MPPEPEDYAIVVGISRYPALGDLEGPEWDARAVADWLEDPDGGGLAADHVQVILCPDPQQPDPLDAEPTAGRVDRALERLHRLGESQGGRAGRRLYLYLAGHGFAPDFNEAALLMANADRRRTGHHIPGRTYADWVRKAGLFDEVVLFMDCCRDNYQSAPLHLPPFAPVSTPSAQTRHLYAFATEWSRKARESPGPDGRSQGIFSRSLLAALRGAAPSKANGTIQAEDLESFVVNDVRDRLAGTGFEDQEPRFVYDKLRQPVFATRGATSFRVRVTSPSPQALRLLDGGLQPVAPTVIGPQDWEWRVPTGLYKLERNGVTAQILEVTGDRDVQL